MSEALHVLPVQQPDADNLAAGRMRQLSRNFPCEPQFIGQWIAIQATKGEPSPVHRSEWSIVGVAKLTGAGYYPGFIRDPQLVVGKSYKRDTGTAGAWGWTFTHVKRLLEPVECRQLSPSSGRYDPGLKRRIWEWTDDGTGDWWGCCPRELDDVTVRRVQEARRKAKRG